MAVRTRSTGDPSHGVTINGRKLAAVATQIGSFLTTWLCIQALGGQGAQGFFIAIVVEFALMAAKHNLLVGRGDQIGLWAILIDTLLNAGGLWPYMQRLDKTPTWAMLVQSLSLEAQLRPMPALMIAIVIGFLLSAAPTWLWRAR